MNTLRSRFILSHILPTLIIVPLIGVILIYALETQILLANLSQRLTEAAHLIIEAVEDNPEIWRDPEKARLFSMQVNYHVEGLVGQLACRTPFLNQVMFSSNWAMSASS